MDNLTIVVPFFNGQRHIGRLLDSLPDVPVIIVDDQSDAPYQLDRDNTTVYQPDKKLYFTGACNYAIERCSTDVLILNQDVWLLGDYWKAVIADNRDRYAMIGERISGEHPSFRSGYIHGVFQFMRRDAIEQVGLMNADLYPLWGASALWQWQVCRAGFESLPIETIPGLHHERQGGYGDSIRTLLQREPERKSTLIRTPPEVSVVAPNYNNARFLPELVDSLMAQTFASFEVIIVDDASTDNSREVIRGLADDWRGVRGLFHPDNRGTAAAMNTGITYATGRYICAMDADDLREPWSLADLYAAQIANPHSLIYDDPIWWFVDSGKRKVRDLGNYSFEKLLSRNHVHAGIMFPRQAWEKVGGYPEQMRHGRQDWAFNVALGMHGYCGVKVERPGYIYRRHDTNRTTRNVEQAIDGMFNRQMRMLYPGLYGGERPMGCCGRKSTPLPASTPQAAPAATPSAADMMLVEYRGRNIGETWGGVGATPTNQKYIFGATDTQRRRYIFKADWPYFQRIRENDINLFVSVQATPAPKQPEPTPEPTLDFDPSDLSVAAIRKLELSADGWALLVEAEKQGKDRKTVINWGLKMADA